MRIGSSTKSTKSTENNRERENNDLDVFLQFSKNRENHSRFSIM